MKKHIGKVSFWWIPALVIIVDQITKYLITQFFPKGVEWTIGFFSIVQIHNTGAGFGIFKDKQLFLIGISIVILAVLIYYKKELATDTITHVAWGLIVGGAIGNLIDRLFLHYVIDFIYFHFWPAFNIADSAISIGAVLLIYHAFTSKQSADLSKNAKS